MNEVAETTVVDAVPAERVDAGQTFTAVGREPYTTRDGREVQLVRWRSNCVVCGAEFEACISEGSHSFPPSRKCQEHRRKRRPAPPPSAEPLPVRPAAIKPPPDPVAEERRLARAARVKAVFDRHPAFAAQFPDGNLPDWAIADSEGHPDPERASMNDPWPSRKASP